MISDLNCVWWWCWCWCCWIICLMLLSSILILCLFIWMCLECFMLLICVWCVVWIIILRLFLSLFMMGLVCNWGLVVGGVMMVWCISLVGRICWVLGLGWVWIGLCWCCGLRVRWWGIVFGVMCLVCCLVRWLSLGWWCWLDDCVWLGCGLILFMVIVGLKVWCVWLFVLVFVLCW